MKSVELSDQEIQALVNLMDAGVKHMGISAAKNAAHLLTKLEAAKDVEVPTTDPDTE